MTFPRSNCFSHMARTKLLGPEGIDALGLAIEERKYEAAKALIHAGAKVNVPVVTSVSRR